MIKSYPIAVVDDTRVSHHEIQTQTSSSCAQ